MCQIHEIFIILEIVDLHIYIYIYINHIYIYDICNKCFKHIYILIFIYLNIYMYDIHIYMKYVVYMMYI